MPIKYLRRYFFPEISPLGEIFERKKYFYLPAVETHKSTLLDYRKNVLLENFSLISLDFVLFSRFFLLWMRIYGDESVINFRIYFQIFKEFKKFTQFFAGFLNETDESCLGTSMYYVILNRRGGVIDFFTKPWFWLWNLYGFTSRRGRRGAKNLRKFMLHNLWMFPFQIRDHLCNSCSLSRFCCWNPLAANGICCYV